MFALELVSIVCMLVLTVVLGTIAHECSHAVGLRSVGISFDIVWFPNRTTTGLLSSSLTGSWAAVTPKEVSTDTPTWGIRLAAMMPLGLAVPLFVLIPVGAVPDPMTYGNPILLAGVIGWLACALPSPQDFSVVWYADQLIETCVADPTR